MSTAPYYEELMNLSGQHSEYIRNGWHHYPCPRCGGRGHHKWPPLGIHVSTGRIKCLRCGLSGVMDNGTYRPVDRKSPVEADSELHRYFSYSGNRGIDKEVIDYVRKRGITGFTGWAYGRNIAIGCVVFPAYNIDGELVFLQWRSIDEDSPVRYRTPRWSTPRVDLSQCQYRAEPFDTLWLVEGPIDAHRLRDAFDLFATPTYTTSPHYQIYNFLKKDCN